MFFFLLLVFYKNITQEQFEMEKYFLLSEHTLR